MLHGVVLIFPLPFLLVAAFAIDQVTVNLGSKPIAFDHYWKRSFGSGHATLTLREDWQRHLQQAVKDLGLQGVRHHGLLDDDMGVVLAPGKYDFTNVLKSWDFQMSQGVTPIVELSFMPAFLANCTWTGPSATGSPVVNPGHEACKTGMQYKHIDQPPADYESWYNLVRALVSTAVSKYGIGEVKKWHFEVWNEMWGMPFPDEYMKLFNASSAAVKSVDNSLKVGGPATMQLLDVQEFIEKADAMGAKFDFVSTHMYPTDPQCPKDGNWGPDCLIDKVKELRANILERNVPLFLTEYNVGCGIGYDQHDTSGAAAFIFRTIPALQGVTDVLSWWTFTDVFEEGTAIAKHNEFMNIYGLMTISGIPKPGWRAFQLLHEFAGDERLQASVTEENPLQQVHGSTCTIEKDTDLSGFDVGQAASPDADACCISCRNHKQCSFWTFLNSTCFWKSSDAGRKASSDAVSGSTVAPPAPGQGQRLSVFATQDSSKSKPLSVFLSYWSVNKADTNRTARISIVGSSVKKAVAYRIAPGHADIYQPWKDMGSPDHLTADQIDQLMQSSAVIPQDVKAAADGSITVAISPNTALLVAFPELLAGYAETVV